MIREIIDMVLIIILFIVMIPLLIVFIKLTPEVMRDLFKKNKNGAA